MKNATYARLEDAVERAKQLIRKNQELIAEMRHLKQLVRRERAALRRFPDVVAHLKSRTNSPHGK